MSESYPLSPWAIRRRGLRTMACMDWDDYLPHEAANPAMPPQDRGRLNSRARPSRLGHSRGINTSGARSLPRSRRTWKSSPQGDVELMTEKEVLVSSRRRDLNRLATYVPSRW